MLWTDTLAPAPSELVVYPGGELRVTFVGNDTDSSALVLLAAGLVPGSTFVPAPGTSLPRDAANATLVYAPTSASRGLTAPGSVSFRDELGTCKCKRKRALALARAPHRAPAGLVGACSFTVAVRNHVPAFATPQAWSLVEDDAEQERGLGGALRCAELSPTARLTCARAQWLSWTPTACRSCSCPARSTATRR